MDSAIAAQLASAAHWKVTCAARHGLQPSRPSIGSAPKGRGPEPARGQIGSGRSHRGGGV